MTDEQSRWVTGAGGWVEHEAVFDAVFTPVTEALLATARIGAGERVLDVGCGTGTLLAAAVEAGATPVGLDISPVMAEAARRRVGSARVVVADAQTADVTGLGGPFDAIVSRFGVMFFDDPVAAFGNIRRAAAPGGRLAFACWRTRAENPMFSLGSDILIGRVDPPLAVPDPEGPGPTAFGRIERLREVLDGAGWAEVEVRRLDFVCDYGRDGTDGVENRLATLLSITSGQDARRILEPQLGATGWSDLLDEIREELRGHLVDGVLRFPGAVWILTAVNPAG
ncbi:MAG: methyltransferase domain-containing protein [Nocardioides sp.]|uniref:class I SAM-dependent methyltransferase n=1 Tax=Nocardioides sp. TaxID=35761 RepID=UPI0039E635FA